LTGAYDKGLELENIVILFVIAKNVWYDA